MSISFAVAFFLALLPGFLPDYPDSLSTRMGVVHTVADGERTQIRLDGRSIASTDAESTSFARFKTSRGDEFVLVLYWRPGLNCHNSFAFLTIHGGKASLTPEFGECTELDDASIKSGKPYVLLYETAHPKKHRRFQLDSGVAREF